MPCRRRLLLLRSRPALSPLASALKLRVLTFRLNKRVHLKVGGFVNFLMTIGSGNLKGRHWKVHILDNLCTLVSDFQSLVRSVYPDIERLSEKMFLG